MSIHRPDLIKGPLSKRELKIVTKMQKQIDDEKCTANNYQSISEQKSDEAETFKRQMKHLEKKLEAANEEIVKAQGVSNGTRDRLHQILNQVRQIPVDADREFILRAIGVVEGMIAELAGATPLLYQEVQNMEAGRVFMMRDHHDHRLDALPYWMQRKA